MYAHPVSVSMTAEFNELLDEEFDAFDISASLDDASTVDGHELTCDGKSWEDGEDY